jgi:hypothetical protein
VLHLKVNPTTEIMKHHDTEGRSSLPKDELTALRAENTSLRRQLAELSHGQQMSPEQANNVSIFVANSEAVTGSSSTAVSTTDSNKLNQRLKEMFKERITSFREAVYLLTGYKVQ